MGRIATTEDVEGIRDEEDVNAESLQQHEDASHDADNESSANSNVSKTKGKYVATVHEVHDAYDAINTLRYSQPTHLQGA